MTQFFETTQGAMALGAVIGIAGILMGLLIGAFPFWLRGARRQREESDLDSRNLAMQAVLSLDDFVGACYAAAHDNPEFNPADTGEFAFHTDDPVLTFPKGVDWRSLKPELADELMWMPNRVRNVSDGLESLDISPPDFDDFFERRQEGFASLGLRALDLIDRLCAAYELTAPQRPSYYRPRDGFVAKVTQMNALWRRRQQTQKNLPKETSNVTPLFGIPRDEPALRQPQTDPTS